MDFPYTDYDRAKRMVQLTEGMVFFIKEMDRYMVWKGSTWEVMDREDLEGELFEKLRFEMHAIVNDETVPDRREKLFKALIRAMGGRQQKDTKECFRELPEIRRSVRDFDSLTTIIPCKNGVYDVSMRTLYPSFIRDLNKSYFGTEYEPKAICPKWEVFLHQALNGDRIMILFLQMVFGYLLLPGNPLHRMFIIYGPAATGKSTVLAVLEKLFGGYVKRTNIQTFNGSGPRNALAGLQFCRLVLIDENDDEESGNLSGSLLKQVIAGETVEARYLYKEFFEFAVRFKIVNSTNHLPAFRHLDDGMKRRLVPIPFNRIVLEEERDPNLLDTLMEELPGILNWAIEGLFLIEKYGFKLPIKIQKILNEYTRNYNSLERFLFSCCITQAESQVRSIELFQAYQVFTKTNGEKRPMSHKTLSMRMQEKGFRKIRISSGNIFIGLALRDISEIVTGV